MWAGCVCGGSGGSFRNAGVKCDIRSNISGVGKVRVAAPFKIGQSIMYELNRKTCKNTAAFRNKFDYGETHVSVAPT